ncbi:diaminobutyrate acetyltransferase [Marivibrio halodurans]|uniref:L-2,4-diaminobutyric acid acetyltransferase n=1 Tax=Marivibrio halodurans TaxID=2039722 RepID=A0A8J7S1J7_9PROT|nr:diaminobutyrate acetyltransferase [Marivibrio halodurans]MBP5856994.1 diaminobutyrate acetyltransferase [Marivibrio halodurans]
MEGTLNFPNEAKAGTSPTPSRQDERARRLERLTLRKPRTEDGAGVNALIAKCEPLDENSVYCNLLQCSHFADTCVVAELDGELVGFVSGYVVPEKPEHFFVWQVAVAEEARGLSLAKRMILDILSRNSLTGVTELHTTITPDNAPSQKLFSSVARTLETGVRRKVMFCEEQHFDGDKPSEILWRIGPFDMQELLPELAEELDLDARTAA